MSNPNSTSTPDRIPDHSEGSPRPRADAAQGVRIACLLVPDLPLHAALRAEPELQGQPLVITSGPGARAEIIALSPEAAAAGPQRQQTLPQARALCPDLEVRVASPVLERAAREALLDVALSLSPRAELATRAAGPFVAEGAVYVDAGGTRALHGNEQRFASMLHARAERAGLRGVVSLASSRGIALLTARHLALARLAASAEAQTDSFPTQILSPRSELAFLGPLPIDLLDPDDRSAQALTRFGLHRIRDLLRLSPRDLATRLGPEILALVARARGEEIEPPLAEPRQHALEEGVDLETPIESLEPLAFVLRGILSRLLERLSLRALGCVELRLSLQLGYGGRDSRRIGVASPTQDERVLLRLLRLALETRPPSAAVDGVVLICEGVPLRREQLDLFLPRGPSPQELDQTLAELAAICGPERVGAPRIVDDHRPGAFALSPFSVRRSGQKTRNPRPSRAPVADASDPSEVSGVPSRLTLRALRPPVRAEVQTRSGRPVFLRSAVSQGEVLTSAGPFRTTGYWWSRTAHFALDHYDLQMSDGCVLRLCFDWRTKWWQVDGLYD